MARPTLLAFAYLSLCPCFLASVLSAQDQGLGECRSPLAGLILQPKRVCTLAINEKVGSEPRRWAPWTHQPYCAGTDYCVYTNALFHGGVSFIATPERAAATFATLEPMLHGAPPGAAPVNTSTPFDVRDIPGKGKGLIASRRIAKGELLLVDYPRFIADTHFPLRTKRERGRQLLQRAADQVADPEQLLNLARSGAEGAHAIEDVMRTNSFSVTIDDKFFMGMFPNIARINHACNPNAFTRFSEKALSSSVMAFRDINKGEEITLSYTDFGLTRDERQTRLQQNWGFTCTCALCSASNKSTAISDDRRQRIREIQGRVAERLQKKKFRDAIKLNHELLKLIREEQLIPHLGEHYHVMAQLYLAAKDRTNGKKYARLALADLEAYGGPDAAATMEELREVLRLL
ncbi:SET domain-containing protein [Thozetella sp. PMI_491]|nr:SET domain-containing protein [Thozetella sp. PMI_491]